MCVLDTVIKPDRYSSLVNSDRSVINFFTETDTIIIKTARIIEQSKKVTTQCLSSKIHSEEQSSRGEAIRKNQRIMADMSSTHQEKQQQEPAWISKVDEIQHLDGLPYIIRHGNKYLCHPTFYITSEVFKMVRNLRLRDDDIWMLSYPKSGNHWSLEVLTMIMNQNTEFSKRPFRYHCTEYLGMNVQREIDNMESPRILGLHLHHPEDYPKEILEKKMKIVYLIRNPKDVFVSAYYMWEKLNQEDFNYRKSFDEFFDLQIKGEFIYGSWFDHVLTFEKFMNCHPELAVYVHSYEKMKEDPVSAIEELCAFLGKPTDLAADIARVTEFGHMKKVLNAGKMKTIQETFLDASKTDGMFRKGIIGDWKNILSPEQSARIDEIFNEKMADSKLADLVRKYM